MTKIVEVKSINANVFVETLFQMFEAGAKYKGGLAVKRPMMVAHLEMGMAGVVPDSPNIRVLPQERETKTNLEVKVPEKVVEEVKAEEPKTKDEKEEEVKQVTKQAPKKVARKQAKSK